MIITTFKDLHDTIPSTHYLTWKDLTDLLTPVPAAYTDHIVRWSPVQYRHGATRGNDSVDKVTALVMDFDDIDQEQYRAVIEVHRRYKSIVHSTWSYSEDHIHMRLVLPLADPIDPKDYPRLWSEMDDCLDGAADASCKDVARVWAVGARPFDAPVIKLVNSISEPLNASDFIRS